MSNRLNIGKDLYIKGRIGWKGLKKEEYLDDGYYKIINATALEDGYIDWSNCGYISKERYEESPEIMLKENDILISKDGTLGKIGYVKNLKNPCSVASGIFVIRNTAQNKVNFDYLYHLLTSHIFKDFINRNKAEGSTINHLYQRDLENFEIDLPSLNVQEKIAFVLNNIDSKIQNNKKQIETLESIAKTIYDYWFVQFDFPNEDGKPYKSSGGKMVWNEAIKGNIPEHWTLGCLYDIADITMGQSPCGNSYNQESRGEIFFQGCSNFGFRFPVENYYTSEPTRIAKENDILMSVRAPVGTLNIALKECCIGRGLAALRHKQKAQSYLYYLLNTFKTRFDILDSSGTTFGALTKDVLFKLKVVIPTPHIVNKFELLAINLDQKIKKLELENRQLCKAKDYILPLIMNGQVSLK